MKWGLLGGTFNPIHMGHLRCAEEIRELFALEEVIFIPVGRPPHKDHAALASFDHRREMVKRAISGNPFFSLSDWEGRRKGMSYSIDTVEHVLSLRPGGEKLDVYYILGQDAFRLIKTWKEWERFLLLCNFVVMTRPNYKMEGIDHILPPDLACRFVYDDSLQGYKGPTGHAIFYRQVSFLDISSSDIRARIKTGKSVRYLIPDAVASYITEEGCYRNKV